jgi:hypothetical protein
VKSNRSQQVSDQFEGMMLKTISHIGKAIARARKYCEIDWDIDTIDVDHLPAEATDAAVANEPSESDTVSKCSSSHADIGRLPSAHVNDRKVFAVHINAADRTKYPRICGKST